MRDNGKNLLQLLQIKMVSCPDIGAGQERDRIKSKAKRQKAKRSQGKSEWAKKRYGFSKFRLFAVNWRLSICMRKGFASFKLFELLFS